MRRIQPRSARDGPRPTRTVSGIAQRYAAMGDAARRSTAATMAMRMCCVMWAKNISSENASGGPATAKKRTAYPQMP